MVITLRAGATLGLALAVSWARPQDVLILRDGTRRAGEVRSCNDASCRVDAESVPRARIVWVGFGQADAAPPAPRNLAPDEVHLVKGEVVSGDVVGLSLGGVLIGEKSFDREEVAWVRFAGPAPMPARTPSPPPPGGPIRGQSSPPAGGPSPRADQPVPPPATPLPPTPPDRATPEPPPGSVRERGVLWTGTLSARLLKRPSPGSSNEKTSFFSLRLREVRVAPLMIQLAGKWQEVGKNIGLENEGSAVTTRETHTAGFLRCWGEGTVTLAGSGNGPGGYLDLKSRDVDVTPALGYDLPRPSGRYAFATYNPAHHSYPATCQTEGRTWPGKMYHPIIQVGRPRHMGPRESRQGLVDPEVRGLVQGRMQGSYAVSDGIRDLTVSWMLCREGDVCPPGPTLPEGPPQDFDKCGRSGQKASLRDTCHAQLDARLKELAPAFAEYNEQMKGAEANRDAFQKAQEFCELYDKATEILEAIVSGGTGPAAKAAQSLVYLRDIIAKAQSGELASLLYPEQLAEYLGYYEKAKAIWFEVTADEISKMRHKLEGCSGKVPIETYLGAKKFIEHFSAAKQTWNSKVAPGLNDLRSKGLECASLDHAAWRECFDDAACRGVPPACGPEPSLSGAYDKIRPD